LELVKVLLWFFPESEKSKDTSLTHITSVDNEKYLEAFLPVQKEKLSNPSTSQQSQETDLCDPPAKRLCVENTTYVRKL